MPRMLRVYNHKHRQHVAKGMPCVPNDVIVYENCLKEFFTPAFMHKLLDREEWKGRPEVFEATGMKRMAFCSKAHGWKRKFARKPM